MCGFAGFWGGSSPHTAARRLRAMADRLVHRGPDGEGYWEDPVSGVGLAHRRLAIVDPGASGAQPMASADGQLHLAYNGEIYNHGDLRAELERAGAAPAWRGHCDTETLLAALAHWGVEATLPRLDGMFALALWDARCRRLWLARDRFGEKPLYLAVCGGALLFASELAALRAMPQVDGDIDALALARFLRYGHVPAPLSILRDVRKLGAGEVVSFDRPGTWTPARRWWRAEDAAGRPESPSPSGGVAARDKRSLDSLHRRLHEAVRSRLMSDVPLGAFLSGGIDSSLVVALMQDCVARPVCTFTIGFDDPALDESEAAGAVARHLGTTHTTLRVSGTEARDVLSALPAIWDEPFADPSQIPTCLVAGLARREVRVCLGGDGGDELYGGYTRYAKLARLDARLARHPVLWRRGCAAGLRALADPLQRRLARVAARPAIAMAGELDRLADLAELYAAEDRASLYDLLLAQRDGGCSPVRGVGSAAARFLPVEVPGGDAQRLAVQRDLRQYLPDTVLVKVDRASMAVGLEARAPLLANASVDWALARQRSATAWREPPKAPLRALLGRYLPPALIERPKRGFGIPLDAWLDGPLRDWAESLMSPAALDAHGMLDVPTIRRWWRARNAGSRHRTRLLWHVLMFQAWWAAQR